ncbi:type VI secretion system ATPase TssH [Acidisoma sp. C75]
MASFDLKSLVGKLNPYCRRALEAAAGLTLSRSHYNVEIEHWLLKLVDAADTDIPLLLRHFEVAQGEFEKQLLRTLDGLRTGNARAPALSPDLVTIMQQAWLFASLETGAGQIRSGHLLWALLSEPALARRAREGIKALERVEPDAIKRDFAETLKLSMEMPLDTGSEAPRAATGGPAGGPAPGTSGALGQYTINLTARARAGKIDPVLGRDLEIRQMVDILTRRRQNNPILTGEAGVGKTAVVEGFAVRLATGDVPPLLRDVELLTLDLGLLQAGAGVKGEFENRLKSVIEEVNASPKPIIIFIDEAHTLIGAGGSAGQGDAANLLKPALARGELRTIAATTWAEYKKYFEKDPALARRFQVIKVEEPTEPVAIAMMRSMVAPLEKHHKVRIFDEAVEASVKLSARYIPSRQLPDKSVSLLDTACARVAMSQSTIPPSIEDLERRIRLIDTEIAMLNREGAIGHDHAARIDGLKAERDVAETALGGLRTRWEQEKKLVETIGQLRERIEAPPAEAPQAEAPPTEQDGEEPATGAEPEASAETEAAPEDPHAALIEASRELAALQGENPLVFPIVDGQAVAAIVENWTGIPAGRMRSDEIATILRLEDSLGQRIIGQPHALSAVSEAIRTSRAQLTDPRKPIGVFLMVGTSGVGKTETALALADLLYGGDQNVTTINMTEFKEEHKVSLLMGSPPGYVGYGEGGVLTEAVRRRPYSVILLDEMEKAHPGVQDVFFQVFDKGNMKDGEGRDIDFKNTVIIMTSNAGTDLITRAFADPENLPSAGQLAELLQPELMNYFKPAFLGRVTLVPYFPLSSENIAKIAALQLGRIRKRVAAAYKARFEFEPEVVDLIVSRCTESSSGARNIEKILSRTVLPELSSEVLARLADGQAISAVSVGVGEDGMFTYEVR